MLWGGGQQRPAPRPAHRSRHCGASGAFAVPSGVADRSLPPPPPGVPVSGEAESSRRRCGARRSLGAVAAASHTRTARAPAAPRGRRWHRRTASRRGRGRPQKPASAGPWRRAWNRRRRPPLGPCSGPHRARRPGGCSSGLFDRSATTQARPVGLRTLPRRGDEGSPGIAPEALGCPARRRLGADAGPEAHGRAVPERAGGA